MSCTVAAANALLNTSRSEAWVILTMVFVTDVPTLEPSIIGIACLTSTPADTRDTIIDVDVAEDCTRTVTRIPIITPTMGFDKSVDEEKSLDKFFPPRIRKDTLRNVKEQIKRYNAKITRIVRHIFLV
uniref:Uncharacterized protein n=1 Tax=Lepeophtheirus salmonis TaxID=72036 RepID=A0A0K2TIV1_LEPSM